MPLINDFLNHAMITLLGVIAIFSIRDLWHITAGKILSAMSVSIGCLAITNVPIINADTGLLYFIINTLSIPHIGLAWWLMLSLLKDDFRLNTMAWLGMALMCFVPTLYLFEAMGVTLPFWDEINVMGSVIPMLMIAHVVWVAWSGKDNDLIEPRRRARLWIASALILTFVVSLSSEWLANPMYETLLSLGVAVPVTVLLLMWITRMQPEVLQFQALKQREPQTIAVNPKDSHLHHSLLNLMQNQAIYKQHGLSINTLANKLSVPSHRLRALINQGMGYRNFAAFLSHYRLIEVKQQLANPQKARLPILSVALEAGFSSLQTFNRVFKNSEQCTPSEYRQRILKTANTPDKK